MTAVRIWAAAIGAVAVSASAPAWADEALTPVLSARASYTVDLMSNLTGGLRRGTEALDKLTLGVDVDGARLGRSGLKASVTLQHVNGAEFSRRRVGDVQTLDNIEAPEALRLFEAWITQDLWGQRATAKLGVIDLNSTFDMQQGGEVFLNSSHGIGPDLSRSGRNGPSIFPAPGLAAVTIVRPAEGWTVSLGAFDGVPGDPDHPRRTVFRLSEKEGALLIAQADRSWGERWRAYLGAWRYTAAYPGVGRPEVLRRDDQGAYVYVGGRLILQGENGGLRGWVRAGVSQARVNLVGGYLGGGLVWRALGRRTDDFLGISVAHAAFGGAAKRLYGLASAETTIEATWGVKASSHLVVQPDLQWVQRPGGRRDIADAVVLGVRLATTLH